MTHKELRAKGGEVYCSVYHTTRKFYALLGQ